MTSSLVLHVAGKDYSIPSPPARVGLALQASYAITQAKRQGQPPPPYAVERAARYDDMTTAMDEDCLGPAWEQMIADDVPLDDLRRASAAAYTWVVTGSERAARIVMGEDVGEEVGSGPKASTTTGEDGTTRKRSSTSGTTSRKGKKSS